MILASIGQENIRSWCYTIIAGGGEFTVVVGWVKLLKAKIATEIARKKSEEVKQLTIDTLVSIAPAINSLAQVAPALVQIANEFHGFKAEFAGLKDEVKTLRSEISENTEITKQTNESVEGSLRDGRGKSAAIEKNQRLVERIAEQSQEAHDKK